MAFSSAEVLLRRAVSEPNEIRDLAEMILKAIIYYMRNLNQLYNEFIADLERGALELETYVREIEELEKDLKIDLEFFQRLLETRKEEIKKTAEEMGITDEDRAVVFLINLPILLKRVGCKTGNLGMVVLGIALGHAYGGRVKSSLCALFAAAAVQKNKWEYAAEIWRRCLGADLETEVRLICGLSKIVEDFNLDELGDLSDVLEELRRA
ncbi:hypothetical protein Pogu_1110 [Pyrobaculum oguniense TE7]|uniref:Uncharacterized protein n=1 Tax=Pyrobaculum oguniense (strain DSM 13380 / JCM 10595 / TE7) TaxID=698757 RepID=H6QA15_PYROT|nr:hypothetical protein Pogu_1110 [Pyrobaculum oguniense TE7]